MFINFSTLKYYLVRMQNNLIKMRATETYHIPNGWKFYGASHGLFRFEMATLFRCENPILLKPFFVCVEIYHVESLNSRLIQTKLSPSIKAAI